MNKKCEKQHRLFNMPRPRGSCVWFLKIGIVIAKKDIKRFPRTSVLLATLVYLPFERTDYEAGERGLRKGNLKRKKEKVKVCASRGG